jgi:GTPase SAR1 family protein
VGPVACGKTSLLMSILQELEHEGILDVNGRVGFSSQVPWIFNGMRNVVLSLSIVTISFLLDCAISKPSSNRFFNFYQKSKILQIQIFSNS